MPKCETCKAEVPRKTKCPRCNRKCCPLCFGGLMCLTCAEVALSRWCVGTGMSKEDADAFAARAVKANLGGESNG